MLNDGDVSNAVALPFLPKPLQWNWKAIVAAGIAASGLGIQACLLISRIRRHKEAHAFQK
jgi:hypothetical protein